jgi:kinetochore protein NDC80
MPRPSLVPRASIQNPRASLIPSSRPSLNQSGIRRLNASMAVGGPKKDPRDWKDKGFVVTCQKRLMKFFSESGFPYALGPKTLTSPSNKEFFQMFQFLYQRFDPSYKFGAKPDDEILPLLTGLNYPFKITKVPHPFTSSSESVALVSGV